MTYFNKYINKTHCYDFEQTGWAWVRRYIEGNEKLCYNMFRMKNEVFHNLCQVLQHDHGLQHSRNIRLEESVAICLPILGHGTCNWMVQEIFQHSGKIISRHFEKMITLLGARFADAYVKPSDPTYSEVPTKIQDHPIYWPHFKVCVLLYIWISDIVYKIIQCMWNWKLLMFLLGLHRCDWWHICDSNCTY